MSHQLAAQMVKQAIHDDQSLSEIADEIHVIFKNGTITLRGRVPTEKEMNLATNTATAVAVDTMVKNRMVVTHNK